MRERSLAVFSICPAFPLAFVIMYIHTNIKPTSWSLCRLPHTHSQHLTLGLGLARCHGTMICRQIQFNQIDLRTQLCCSHVHELACCWYSTENSLAREFACSGGANQLSNFCNEQRSKLCNFMAVQRPSLLPKDSAEFRGWYDTLPQTQPKESEAFQAWQKALPQTQLKESEAYKAWQKANLHVQPKESEAYQAWQKADPARSQRQKSIWS